MRGILFPTISLRLLEGFERGRVALGLGVRLGAHQAGQRSPLVRGPYGSQHLHPMLCSAPGRVLAKRGPNLARQMVRQRLGQRVKRIVRILGVG